MKDEDPAGLLRLSILLQKCRSALSDIGEYAGINFLHCLLPILRKLPKSLQDKWIEWSVDVADKTNREAGFVDLANFVAHHSRPWNSLFGQSLYCDGQSRQTVERRKSASLYNVAAEESTLKRSSTRCLRGKCSFCNENHNLHSCSKFVEKSVLRRRDFVMTNALCFRCLLAGHVVSENRLMAEKRLNGLKKRLIKDEDLCRKYVECMQTYIDKGYAEEVVDSGRDNAREHWFVPHHPVVHPRKPGKVRIVFDCAAKHKRVSLNDVLLQGPDYLNSLFGVLTRFRKERVALVADIEGMYHQIKVHPKD